MDLLCATSELHPAAIPSLLRGARPGTALCRAAAAIPLPCPVAARYAATVPAKERSGRTGTGRPGLRLVGPVLALVRDLKLATRP